MSYLKRLRVTTRKAGFGIPRQASTRHGAIVFCLAALLFPLSSIAAGTPSSLYCSCLETAPNDLQGKRVGGSAFSMVVPRKATQRRIDSEYSEEYEWVDGWTRIGSNYSFHVTVHFDALPSDECEIRFNGRRLAIRAYDDDHRPGFIASFEPDHHPDGFRYTLAVKVNAYDVRTACTIGASVLHSVAFVNDWKRMEVVAIASDRATAVLRNEIGETKKVQVGDIVTRDQGKVTRIGPLSVEITEWLGDGSGGWREFVRVLALNQRGQKP